MMTAGGMVVWKQFVAMKGHAELVDLAYVMMADV